MSGWDKWRMVPPIVLQAPPAEAEKQAGKLKMRIRCASATVNTLVSRGARKYNEGLLWPGRSQALQKQLHSEESDVVCIHDARTAGPASYTTDFYHVVVGGMEDARC